MSLRARAQIFFWGFVVNFFCVLGESVVAGNLSRGGFDA